MADASVADWFGAAGTWVVGLAAGWLAFQANKFAVQLRNAERARVERTARAVVQGVLVDFRHYKRLLTELSEDLPASEMASTAGIAIKTSEALKKFMRFDLDTNSISVLGDLPEDLATQIAVIYAKSRTARAVFAHNEALMRVAGEPKSGEDASFLRWCLKETVEATKKHIVTVEAACQAMEAFLGSSLQSKPS